MTRPNVHFGVVYLCIAAVVHLKPEYRVLDSSVLTFIGLAILATGLRIVYNLSLYPRFFTPLRYLPTPSVRSSNPVLAQSYAKNIPRNEHGSEETQIQSSSKLH